MKRIFTTLTLSLFFAVIAFAQGGITGKIMDGESNEALIGASVLVKGTSQGTITDFDGNFSMQNLDAGDYTLVISYIGFTDMEVNATVGSGITDLGRINVASDAIGLAEVEVIASLAVDRKTPVAVTTIKGETIEALIGNQEFPEMLRNTPSIYVTKSGGGFGDARINVRGFDQSNTAVMINGIPVNDMENGWVYWSNWAGLSDVTSSMQVQRGLGASKLAVPAVGGSINIVTNAADFSRGGKASVTFGNDGFAKYGLMMSSGQNEKGFAATAQFTHTRGDAYVDGTSFRAYSYFLSLSQRLGDKASLAFTVVGAPQWHHQRTLGNFDRVFLQTFLDDERGIKFNPNWGMLDGEEFTWRRNFYHKPKAFVNHYWNINEKTDLKTSAYVSIGRGGGTGPRGRLRTPGSVFDSYSGNGKGIHDANGQVRFDDIVAYNQGREIADWGSKVDFPDAPFAGQKVVTSNGSGDGSGFIRRASMNSHNWFGVLSTLTTKLNNRLNLVGGIDARYYKGEHYRRLENLLGADAYLSKSDDNNPLNFITETAPATFGNFADNSYREGNNVLNYHNDGLVSWLGAFAQLEFNTEKLSTFLSLSGSNQGFKRIDFFNYLETDPERESDWQNFLGGTAKLGLNYNLDDHNNVFFNAGYLSRQPLFDNVFINFRNDLNPNVSNQDIIAAEVGYGLRTRNFRANVNLYATIWDNRQFDESFDALALTATGDTLDVEALVNYSGVKETHTGVELELAYTPIRQLTFTGMASLSNWIYSETFTGNVANTDTDDPLIGVDPVITIFADGIKVGDAAQTTFAIGAVYEPIFGLKIRADYYYADNLFAEFNILETQFRSEGGAVAQLPAYSLVNAGVSYTFDISNTSATINFNMNNVFDEIYVAEMDTNVMDDPSTPDENEFYTQNRGFYGFGRTWNAGIKWKF